MAETSIEWSDWVWNILRGCSEISPGCLHCYAAVQAWRFAGPGMPYEGLVKRLDNGKIVWTGKLREVPEKLSEPFHWRKPRKVFVNSMSDLFHEDVSDDFLDRAFAVMAQCPQHTFQVLTKRAERAALYLNGNRSIPKSSIYVGGNYTHNRVAVLSGNVLCGWPLQNVWLGVSVEDQKRADERLHRLRATPAAVRFVSYEPALGPVANGGYCPDCGAHATVSGRCQCPTKNELHWWICGGESGSEARDFKVNWARTLRDHCRDAGVAFYLKQMGRTVVDVIARHENAWPQGETRWWSRSNDPSTRGPILRDPKGGDPDEWPEDLRVREFPELGKAVAR